MGPKEETDKLNKMFKREPIVFNRAQRRKKPRRPHFEIIDYVNVPSNIFTKATHKIKKIRKKNEPSKQQRKRAIAKARKNRKESYSQIS